MVLVDDGKFWRNKKILKCERGNPSIVKIDEYIILSDKKYEERLRTKTDSVFIISINFHVLCQPQIHRCRKSIPSYSK